mgnify:CR=1 FL=1
MDALLDSVAATVQTLDQVAGVQVVLGAPEPAVYRAMGSAGFGFDPSFRFRLVESRARGARLVIYDGPATPAQRVLPDRRRRMLDAPEWAPMHPYLRRIQWGDYVATPIPGHGRGGAINCYLTPGARATDGLLRFLRGMASVVAAASPPAHDDAVLSRLTPRERDVLALLGDGLSNRDLGLRLGISERTARTHVSNVLTKLGVASRTQAALLVARQ